MAILTVEQAQGHITTTLGTDELQRLLDAAEEDINNFLGPGAGTYDEPTAINELITTQSDLLLLGRPAEEILTVIEVTTTLAADDYELRSSGHTVRRLNTGTNPRRWWYGRIDITYVPRTIAATKERVQLELLELSINFTPGASSERIGDWAETLPTGGQSQASIEEQRAAILAGLVPSSVGIW